MTTRCAKKCLNSTVCKWVGCIYRHPLVNDENLHLFTSRPMYAREFVAVFEMLEPPKSKQKIEGKN